MKYSNLHLKELNDNRGFAATWENAKGEKCGMHPVVSKEHAKIVIEAMPEKASPVDLVKAIL